jgi:haloalkane dehalogenase
MNAPTPRPHAPDQPVVPADEPWADEYPFESQWLDVGDGDPLWMHYVDEGPRDAPVLLFLHGNPTWSFIWRKPIAALRDRFRCIAVDHIGCGLSDRPTSWDYTLPRHADNVEKLLDALGVERFGLVVHDWGGMIGFTVATRRPEALECAVVTNTSAFLEKLPKRIALVKAPFLGPLAVLGGNAFARSAVRQCVVDKSVMTKTLKRAYLAPYSTPRDRLATLRFVQDVPTNPNHRTWSVIEGVDKKLAELRDRPMLLVWGEQDWCFSPKFREGFEARFPDAEVVKLDDVAHYLFEEAPDRLVGAMTGFLGRTYAEPAAAE